MKKNPIRIEKLLPDRSIAAFGLLLLALIFSVQTETRGGEDTKQAAGWQKQETSATPAARIIPALAFDAKRNVTVLFGGDRMRSTPVGDTWEYDGKNWRQIETANAPAPRYGHQMVFDKKRGTTLLFGGYDKKNELFNDTWEYDGKDWKRIETGNAPPVRRSPALVFDEVRGRVILFGGLSSTGGVPRENELFLADTWEFDGKKWERTATAGPAPRYGPAMVYDPPSKKTILFGGNDHSGNIYGDTWEWDGKVWKKLSDTGINPRATFKLVHSKKRDSILLFGGFDRDNVYGDVWEWKSGKWQKLDLPEMPKLFFPGVAFDEKRNVLLMFGQSSGQGAGETWELNLSEIETAKAVASETDKTRAEQFGKDVFAGEIYRGSFSADGKTFYFFKKVTEGAEDYRIFESNFVNGNWTAPKKLDLGGEHSDLYPSISKDGKRLVFASYRPAAGDDSEKRNAHLWYVDRRGDGWSEPVFLSKANKPGHYHSWAEFGWDGDIYFRQTTPDWKVNKTLITRWNGTEYGEPVLFEEVERWKDWNPDVRIAGGSPGPNKEMIFLDVAAKNPKTGRGASDIWMSIKKDGEWREPKPLGAVVNADGYDVFPFYSPDGKTLYFVRDFREFYRIPIETAVSSIEETTAITIDGNLSTDEWKDAKKIELTDGGEAFYKFTDEAVWLGVRGGGEGWITVYATDGESVYALHASAALGTARYKRGENGVWKNMQKFEYVARDPSMSAEAVRSREEFYKNHGWVANVGRMGEPDEREFKISNKFANGKKMKIAIVYTTVGNPLKNRIFPQKLPDDTLNAELIRGETPAELKFNPDKWAMIEP
jgi:hypothetical protein